MNEDEAELVCLPAEIAASKAARENESAVDQRASVNDLLGADPDHLGGQSVDDYIREARRDR